MPLQSHEWQSRFYQLALLPRMEKMQAVEKLLTHIWEGHNIAALLDEFIFETKRAVHENIDSYFHDNGFDKIVLFQDDETKMKLRLHVWYPMLIPGQRRQRQNVHNHRWDFSSLVLTGQATNLTYRMASEGENGEELYHYRYYARGSKEHYDVEFLGKSKVVVKTTERHNVGKLYSVDNEVLHRVDIDDDATVATLVVTHENVSWVTNDLLSEKSMGTSKARLPSPAMTNDIIVAKVKNLREHMGI